MTRKKPKLRLFLLPARTSGLLLALALLISFGFGSTAHAAAAPTITSISPATGSTAGGDSVIISGTNFATGDAVAIGGNAASNVTVVNSTTITATTPAAGSTGSADVTVTDTSSQTATLPGSFTYTASNLISWWKLDGNANDSSGSGFNGTVNGATATTDRFGTASGALSFNGTSNYLDMGNVDNMGTGSLTVSAWFKTTASSSGVTNRTLVAKSLYGSQTGRYSIVQSGGSLQGMFADSSGAGQAVTTSETPYLDGVWHQVTMVYDHSGSASLYVDGVLKGSKTMTGVASANMTNADHFFIGAYENSSGTAPQASTYFSGSIDDVRVYNRALSQSEVTALYDSTAPTISAIGPTSGDVAGGSSVTIAGTNFASGDTVSFGGNAATNVTVVNSTTIVATAPASSGVGTVDVTVTDSSGHSGTLPAAFTYTDGTSTQADLISWWKLNGNANDSTLYARNGTVNGATSTTGYDGTTNGAYTFNGSSNYLNFDNVDNMGTGSLTVSAWFKTTQSSSGGSSYGIVSKSLRGAQAGRYFILQTAGSIEASFADSSGAEHDAVTSEAPYIDGNWHLVTAVYDRAGNDSLYIDGTLKATTDMSAYAGANFTSIDNLYVGVYNDASGTSPAAGTYFNGSIDDVRVYSRALSAGEVAGLYNVPPPGITGITPASGSTAGGDSVTITGTNFVNGATVAIGGATATNVTVVNSTTITATTPAGTTGSADVVVTSSDGSSATLSDGFTYGTSPQITAVTPHIGTAAGGTTVTVQGSGFEANAPSITTNVWTKSSNTLPAAFERASLAVVGNYVYLYGGSANSTAIYRASTADPTTWTTVVGKTLPAAVSNSQIAVVGNTMYIFGGDNSKAILTASTADPTTWTNTGKTLPVNISTSQLAVVGSSLYLFGGSSDTCTTNVSNAIYTASTADPTTWTNTGKTLPAGVCWGSLFNNGANLYLVGGYNARTYSNAIYSAPLSNPTTWTNTGKTLPVSEGILDTTVIGSNIYLLGGFNGSSLSSIYSAPLSNPTTWTNTGKTLPIAVNNSGMVAIINNNLYVLGGYSTSATTNAILSAPITRAAGSNYNNSWSSTPDPAATTFKFDGVAATSANYVTATDALVVTPAHVAGTVNVTATSSAGLTGQLTNGYTYVNAPTISTVSPTSAMITGGDTVTISGTNFAVDAAVTIGGAAATNVTVVNSTTITATTPAGTAGPADVVVTNTDGGSVTLPGGFTYTSPLAPTSGLIGWWKLDGNANDSSGNGYNGTINNSVTPVADRNGVTNGALNFGGTSSITIGSNPAFTHSLPFTVSTWVNGTSPTYAQFVNKYTSGSWNGFNLLAVAGGKVCAYYMTGTTSNNYTAIASDNGVGSVPCPVIPSGWHLLTVTVSTSGMVMYVDGSSAATSGWTGTAKASTETTPMTFGTGSYSGSMDDVRIYNRALSSSEITQLYAATPPTITSISPSTGAAAGGDSVSISGTNFTSGTTVTIGGNAATNVMVVNSTTLTATTPAGAGGAADVVVTNPDGYSATLSGGYTYGVPLAITAISPSTGSTAGGDSVTITGTNFVSGATVTIGGIPATSVQYVNSTTLTATTPAGTTGTADVVVTNPDSGSATLAAGYTYQYPAPMVTAISPANGPATGGTAVTVTGSNFQAGVPLTTTNAWTNTGTSLPAGNQVATIAVVGGNIYMYGGSAGGTVIYTASTAAPTSWTNTGKTLPSVGTGAVFVQIGPKLYLFGGNSSNVIMTADAADPTTWSVVSGKTLPTTLSWSRLAIVGSTLYLFGGSTTTCAQGSAAVNKIYSAPVADPTTWSDTGKALPANVCGAALLRNSSNLYLAGGSNGSSVTTAIYTASLSDPTTWSDTGKALPAGSVYNNTVAIIGSTAYIFGGYNYTNCSTSIYSAPLSDLTTWSSAGTLPSRLAGSTLAIAGNNMYLFGGSNCSVVTGTIYKTPITRGPGTNYNPAAISDPTVYTSISLGGTALTNQQYVSSTQLTGTTAAHASGSVDIVATSSDGGTGTLRNGYTYGSSPTVTGISPGSGVTSGGDSVTITGTDFENGATVTIGGNAATGVTVVNSTTITATTPAGTAGSSVDVIVTNPDGGSTTLTGGYTYISPPSIGAVSPSSGDVAGGYTMTISGSNFASGDAVTIGGTPATNVTLTTKTYAIGDTGPGGGIIFYDKGIDTDGWRYLEAAPSDQSAGVAWCSSWTNVGTTDTAIGTGQANTATILRSSCSAGAAKAAANYTGGGYTDWFLPSKDELNQLYAENGVVGGFAAGDYWSSSQANGQQAWKQNFGTGAQQAFNQTYAFHVRAIREVNSTVLTATVPAAASAGTVDVTVTDTNGQSTTLTGGFTYMNPAPTITNVSPTSGTTVGGDSITITGTNFVSGDSVTIGGATATGITVVNSTTITATTPAGTAGVADIVVRDSSGSFGTLTSGFTYINPPPTISSFTPTVGKMQGGTTVTFTGSGFTSDLTAYFDGVAATTVGATGTTLTVKTPAGALGDVAVTVGGPQTQTATAPDTFRYAPDAYAFTSAPLNVHATEPDYITIEARDKNGSAVSAPYDITLALTSLSSGGSFSTDGTSWGVTNVTIPAGQSSVSFYYKDANKGTPSVTATGPAGVSVSQTETITSRYILLVTGVSDPIDAGVPSSITVQATDWQGIAVNDYTGTIHFSSDDNYASLPTDFTITSDMRGHHTFVNGVTLVTTGEHCVTATDTSDSNIAGQQCNITVNGGYSGAASKLVVITDPQSAETSTPTAAITVQVQDSSGNPAPVPVDTTVYVSSSSGSGSFSTDGVNGWSSTQPIALTIKANTTSANVYYQDSSAGTKTLSFKDESSGTDTGLTDTAQSVYIGAGAPAALAMSVSSSQPYGGWVPVRVSLKDSNGVPATNPDSPLPIYFTSDNSALQFSLDSAGSNPAGSLTATIPVGGNQTTAYVHASDIEAGTITASDASPADGAIGLADTSASINFIAHNPSKIALSTSATTGVDTPVAVTITQTNDLGQPAGSSSDSAIALSDANHGGSFSLSDTNWQPVGSVTLPAGSSSVTVYYKTTTAGTVTLDASGLSEATTSLTVTPGAYTQLVFAGGPSSVPVTEATGFSVTAEDMYGNVVTLGSATPVYLYTNSGSGSFAASSNGSWSTTSVDIPAGGSSANFYYKDTNLHGTATLTVSDQSPLDSPDSGITNTSRTVNITGETASKLVFTTSPQTVAPGHSSRIITVQAQTSSGQPAIQGSDRTIYLSSNSTGSYSFTASTGSGAPSITEVTIPAGGTSASFYYSDTKAGTHTLSATSGSLSANQGITISASVASQLTFVTPAQNGQTNQPSQQIEIGVADTYGNATTVGFDTTVGLSSSCSDSSFSLSNTSWSPVTQVTIPAGGGSAYFYFKTSANSCQLSISADNLDGAAQQFTAATGPAKIALSGLPASLEAGQAATVHVSLEDTSGNLVPALNDTTLHVFASGGTADQNTVTVSAGSSSADVQFTAATTPGSGELQVRDQSSTIDPDTGLIDAAASTTITAPVPSALSVTPASANASVSASKQLTVALTNAYGITATATTDITVNLATTGSGSFAATSDTAAPAITSVTIPTGSSAATVYYHQTDTGSVQLTMSGSSLSSGTATLAFLSGDIASYQFAAAPSSAEAGQAVNFGLQALDQYGNVVTLVRGQHIYLASSAGGGTFGGGYYYSGSHSLIVPNNATSIGFSYKDNTPGSHTITASDVYPPDDPDSGIINAIANIDITSAVPAQLVFTSSGGSFERGGVSNQISVQVQSNYGIITPLTSGTTFTLASSSPTGQFALSNAGPWTLKQLTIPAGSSSGAFYYRDNTNTGSQTINISGGGLAAANQSLSVLKGAPASLYFITPPQTLYATHTSPAIEVGVNNRYGYPTVIGDQSLLSLSTTSATAQFANTLPNWGASGAPWTAGTGSASFRYRDSQPGSSTITAHIDGLIDASQPVTVLQQVFDHFLVTNISDPQQAGTPSSVVVIAQDAGNYTVAGYNGTIHFTSSDPEATLPADYTFQPYYDKGLHTFTNGVIFALSGEQTVTVTDIASGLSGTQQAITVLGGETGGTTNPGGGDTGTSGSGTTPGSGTGSSNPRAGSGSTSTKGGNGSTGTSTSNTGSSAGSKNHQHQSGSGLGSDQASAMASGGFGHALGEHIKRILHSPATPYVVPGIFYFLIASFAAILLWDMYREIKNADLLLKILKRERRTAEDKTQFLNLVAHHARTPVTIIAGGAELIASMAAGDRFAAALSDCAKRLQATANGIVEAITNQVRKPDEPEPPVQAELERKLYLSPLFWAPIGIGIGLTWLINWLATAVGHQDVHGTVIALQLLVAALAAALLYSALRGRHLRSRRKEALERSLEHRRQLDDGKNAFITSIGSQLAQYTDELQPLNNYFQQNKPAAAKPLNNGVNQLQKLVETMQTLSSISTAEVQTGQFKLGSVLDQALLSHNQQIAGKQLDIATDGADQTVLTQDQRLLGRVTDTLLDNAIAFSPSGGKIAITANTANGQTAITVSDNGPGLPKVVTDQLLQPFTHPENTLNETHQGLGLSLYLDTLIMRHLGGSLRASSSAQGTTITLEMPSSAAAS